MINNKKILSIINAGLKGHKPQMLRYMQTYVDSTESTDYFNKEFRKKLGDSNEREFLINEFNRKYKYLNVNIKKYDLAWYQLNSDDVCEEIFEGDFAIEDGSVNTKAFVKACELEVTSKKRELIKHYTEDEE